MRNKNDHQSYFDYLDASKSTEEESNNEEAAIFRNDQDKKKKNELERVLYFIDEQAEIQLVHTKKVFKNMKE